MYISGKSVRSWCDGSSDQSFMVDKFSYFSSQPVLHVLRGMCYPICGMVHIKDPFLLIGKSSPCCGGSGFSLSLSGSLPYVRRQCISVLSVSLNMFSFPTSLFI